ncbi:MAG: hypothetical protein HY286_13015 [Planctomycetes bacterium]|nr:hypothetical protein [Planctomycetota bacterium]
MSTPLKRNLVPLAMLASILCVPFQAAAQAPKKVVTRRCTNRITLDGSGNIGNKAPAPAFKLPKVDLKLCLSVNKETGQVTQEVEFRNNDAANEQRFLFCNMIELSAAAANVNISNDCNMGFKGAPDNKWVCVTVAPPKIVMMKPGYHFGCIVVELKKKGDPAGKDVFRNSQTGQSDDFKCKEAKDFQVCYADLFNLKVGGMDVAFDTSNCANCFGKNKGINFAAPKPGDPPPNALATGFWIMSDVPVTDPFIQWQEFDGTMHAPDYVPIDSELTLPSQFPLNIPEMNKATPGLVPPNCYSQDLDLWDIQTMSAEDTTLTDVLFIPFVDFDPFGIVVQPDVYHVGIEGGSMDYANLLFAFNTGMPVPEGTRLPFSVGAIDAFDLNNEFWEEDGLLIQDTVPPHALSHSEMNPSPGILEVSITAEDVTTSPLAADFFYSLDGGATWLSEPLDATLDPFDEPSTNEFHASIAVPTDPNQSIVFFYQVQDSVMNNAYIGPGTMALLQMIGTGTPGCAGAHHLCANVPPKIGAADFQLKCDNAPPAACGISIITDKMLDPGADPFGLGVMFHIDLLGSSQMYAFDMACRPVNMGLATVPIPNDPNLSGQTFFAQSFWFWNNNCQPSPSGVSSSNALVIPVSD